MERRDDLARVHVSGITFDFEYGELWRGLHRSNPLSFKKPYSWIVYKDRDVYMAEDWRGRIRYEDDDASEVIQSALNSLTPNRTWKERVVLVGDFEISSRIIIPSYTILDLSSAYLKLKYVNDDKVLYISAHDVTIEGGVIDGDKETNTEGIGIAIWGECYNIGIKDVKVMNFANVGISIDSLEASKTVKDVKIVNCKFTDNENQAIYLLGVTENVRIQSCIFERVNSAKHMIYCYNIRGANRNLIIEGNKILKPTAYPIRVSGGEKIVIKKNRIEGIEEYYTDDSTGGTADMISLDNCTDFVVEGNILVKSGDMGITIENSSKGSVKSNIVAYCDACGITNNSSVNVLVTSNVVYNNNKNYSGRTLSDPAGIRILDSTDIIVVSNRCFDDQDTPTQEYGIREVGTSDYNIITNNNCRGNATGGIATVGTNTVTGNNIT